MATLQGPPLQDLPELVRDSHLEATFHPNADIPTETTHLKYQGRRRPQREKWIRQKMLGRGGFGIVWLEKREPESSATYNFRAVKQLDIAKVRSKRHDYVRELEALAKFSQTKYSEFFVKSYGWFQSPSALFFAMEYCELGDLKDHVEEHGKLAEEQVQDIGWQILQGLKFMHHNNFAHRDLKPANILIKNKPPYGDWHVKICDLGLSKRIGTDDATTTVQGTPGFMPPESVPGIGDNPRHIDPFPADMWCLGETIFYLLTRKRTFGGDLMQLRQYWKGGSFPKEPLLHVRASDAAISFVQELMARLPVQRLTAEMADEHELMKTEPFQEPEQETRETSEGGEGSSTMIPEDPASGRWTTGASHQQGLGVPSGSWDSIIVEEALPDQIPRSPGNTELASNDTGPPPSSAQEQPDRRGTDILTQYEDNEMELLNQLRLKRWAASIRPNSPPVLRREDKPQPVYRSVQPRPSNVRHTTNRSGSVINLLSHESSQPSSTRAERRVLDREYRGRVSSEGLSDINLSSHGPPRPPPRRPERRAEQPMIFRRKPGIKNMIMILFGKESYEEVR